MSHLADDEFHHNCLGESSKIPRLEIPALQIFVNFKVAIKRNKLGLMLRWRLEATESFRPETDAISTVSRYLATIRLSAWRPKTELAKINKTSRLWTRPEMAESSLCIIQFGRLSRRSSSRTNPIWSLIQLITILSSLIIFVVIFISAWRHLKKRIGEKTFVLLFSFWTFFSAGPILQTHTHNLCSQCHHTMNQATDRVNGCWKKGYPNVIGLSKREAFSSETRS